MRWCGASSGLFLLFVPGAYADTLNQPLTLADRMPLIQVHGLPPPRSGEILATGRTETRLQFDVANHFVDADSSHEQLILDGETQRLELGWRAGIGHDWEVGVILPVIQHSGGNLDSFIEGWHDVFGLPDGGRPPVVRNRMLYHYQRYGVTELDMRDRESGIGGLQLSASYQLWQGDDGAVALATSIKLPTGDANRLTDDDTTTTDLTLAASTRSVLGSVLQGYVNAGMLWLPGGDVLPERQRDAVWHAGAGLSLPVYSWLALKVQVEMYQAFYRSDVRAIGHDAALLTLGGTARLSPHWMLDIGVGEDIIQDTAPDVTMQIALRWVP